MKQYIGTKLIKAEPAYRVRNPGGDYQITTDAREAFQEAYRPTEHMNFGLAIEAARKGKRIARKGWNGKGQYVELASAISYTSPGGETVNANHEAIGNHAFAFVGTSGVQMGWLASQADMLADDWTIVE